jgi:short-subunit dehydrogenase
MSSIDSFSNLFPYINQNLKTCEKVLSLIGLYFVTKTSLKLLYELINKSYIHIWSQLRPIQLSSNKMNEWAIISDDNPMGLAFAKQLALKKFNLIIIGTNEKSLQLIENQISFIYKVKVITISAHLSQDFSVYDLIERQISDKEIAVLVNNVSVMSEMQNFSQLKRENILQILNSNISPVLLMTHLVLPQMVSRGRGVIINISSLSALKPIPRLSAYSASKAFVDHFSRGLSFEYKSKGIIIQSLIPSFIYSPLSPLSQRLSSIPLIAPNHETYAKFAINTIGFTNRTTGYIPHEFQYFLHSLIPERIWFWFCTYSLRLLTLNSILI